MAYGNHCLRTCIFLAFLLHFAAQKKARIAHQKMLEDRRQKQAVEDAQAVQQLKHAAVNDKNLKRQLRLLKEKHEAARLGVQKKEHQERMDQPLSDQAARIRLAVEEERRL